ncbi:MAG: lamin tail domain-containing protein [Williamsia sp.]|nr:lamin tail domain-containing protein [Williamsia sp.]
MRWLYGLLLLLCGAHSSGQVNRYDVVIDEIMADPSPVRGLPEVEFIELKNVSSKGVNLNGWKISDATGTATVNQSYVLQPDSFVILCSTSASVQLSSFGATLGIPNFPSLDNDGELLTLRAGDGRVIHALAYSKLWYGNALKSEGGWTLEMMDVANACSGASNWTASRAESGGTPGKKNSVDAVNRDGKGPVLLRSYARDSLSLVLTFDEPLDSASATVAEKYKVSDGIGIPRSVVAVSPLFTQLILFLNLPLQKNKPYTVEAKKVPDCSGNLNLPADPVKTGLAVRVDTPDIVINEILFNPKPGGGDYVEVYNGSKNIVDLKELFMGNRSSLNTIGNLHQLAPESRLLFPDEYLVLTADASILQQDYLVKNPAAVIEMPLPSYPDDKGTVVLLNNAGKVIDELRYDEKWHFKLIDDRQGVALERISFNKPTQDPANWHSAATKAGYGTPTYRNSQASLYPQLDGTVTISPQLFSPNNDGRDDFTTIAYQLQEPGYVCNITLFNVQGFVVRMLVRNALCGTSGYFRWDGLDEKNNALPGGQYIALIEFFDLHGKTGRFKQVITLVKRVQ